MSDNGIVIKSEEHPLPTSKSDTINARRGVKSLSLGDELWIAYFVLPRCWLVHFRTKLPLSKLISENLLNISHIFTSLVLLSIGQLVKFSLLLLNDARWLWFSFYFLSATENQLSRSNLFYSLQYGWLATAVRLKCEIINYTLFLGRIHTVIYSMGGANGNVAY